MDDISFEIKELILSNLNNDNLKEMLSHYHESDIADAVELLTKEERHSLLLALGVERCSEIFPYLENVDDYVDELDDEVAADILENMDADDALDVLQELDEEDRASITDKMEEESREDVKLLGSFDEDEIGASMTTNFISIPRSSTIKSAMRLVVSEAADNDNVYNIYVCEDDGTFYGSIELKDLIVARSSDKLEDIIHINYPTLNVHDLVEDKINDLKDYSLDMVPVLDDSNKLVGVITSSDVIEAVDEALGEDYAKLGGLSNEEDLDEPFFKSLKKRLPWLCLLLILGLMISMVISRFEGVIMAVPMIAFFQSIVLDMAGNVGTQSLAVTIRFLSDEDMTFKNVSKMVYKEVRVGFANGVVLGTLAFITVFLFLFIQHQPITGTEFLVHDALYLSMSILVAVVISLTLASFVAVVIPCLLRKMHVDPAVASGPLITTIDDLVAVVTYFGIAMAFFSELM